MTEQKDIKRNRVSTTEREQLRHLLGEEIKKECGSYLLSF